MPKIKKLSPDLISKIAAGEVIERPAFAVKELIDNALDAEASKIIINLENYGFDKISIFDNGFGFEKGDLEIAIEPHTSSKISSADELNNIQSMGFRGEALSSIASISDLEILSRATGQKKGNHLKDRKVETVGMPQGTQVIIKNIFYKTPVRKKFLKTKETEYRHILQEVQSFALSHPSVEFKLSHNNKLIYDYKNASFEKRLKDVFGGEIIYKSLSLKYADSYIKIEGVISHPENVFKSKNKLYIFVNRRKVQNTSLLNTIKEGYRNLLMSFDFPLSVVNIILPSNLVDVNVHPRKEIIKFSDENFVLESLKNSVIETLDSNNLTFSNLSFKNKLTKTDIAKLLKQDVAKTPEAQIGKVKSKADVIQVLNSYLITETENGLLILDQHAVHEAILYYKYKKAYKNKKNQGLSLAIKKPKLVTLSEQEQSILEEHKEYIEKLGYEILEFGDNTYKLSSVPIIATDLDPEKNLKETLEELSENNKSVIEEDIDSMLAYLSCRSAIKSGQKLSKKDIKDLIKYLDKIDLGYTCPHGRPVKLELSKDYLDILFRRR